MINVGKASFVDTLKKLETEVSRVMSTPAQRMEINNAESKKKKEIISVPTESMRPLYLESQNGACAYTYITVREKTRFFFLSLDSDTWVEVNTNARSVSSSVPCRFPSYRLDHAELNECLFDFDCVSECALHLNKFSAKASAVFFSSLGVRTQAGEDVEILPVPVNLKGVGEFGGATLLGWLVAGTYQRVDGLRGIAVLSHDGRFLDLEE